MSKETLIKELQNLHASCSPSCIVQRCRKNDCTLALPIQQTIPIDCDKCKSFPQTEGQRRPDYIILYLEEQTSCWLVLEMKSRVSHSGSIADQLQAGANIIQDIIDIANSYFGLDKISNLEIVIDDAFEYVLKTKLKYDLIIIDIFEDTTMPSFLFQDFFIQRINSLLNLNGFILFNTMVINKKEEERNLIYKSKFGGDYSLRMYPKVELHNELFTIKKLS